MNRSERTVMLAVAAGLSIAALLGGAQQSTAVLVLKNAHVIDGMGSDVLTSFALPTSSD